MSNFDKKFEQKIFSLSSNKDDGDKIFHLIDLVNDLYVNFSDKIKKLENEVKTLKENQNQIDDSKVDPLRQVKTTKKTS